MLGTVRPAARRSARTERLLILVPDRLAGTLRPVRGRRGPYLPRSTKCQRAETLTPAPPGERQSRCRRHHDETTHTLVACSCNVGGRRGLHGAATSTRHGPTSRAD